ncbi:hypothetical protein VTJ49DRAFT_2167 [Mycothermus thermophilus]|uniref:Trafficking protein particle complex subunit 6B n=1 Tax=Humicola insolens TaxID=85995 RepID=A0ABR3VAJ3_HUMIN
MSFEPVMPPYNASDPSARFVSASCLDFLLIELVPMAHRITRQLEGRAKEEEERWLASLSSSSNPTTSSSTSDPAASGGGANGNENGEDASTSASAGRITAAGGAGEVDGEIEIEAGTLIDEEEEREAVFWRLEAIGYRVGQGLAERFSRDRPRFNDTLDIIKFLCKDLWTLVFRKQVDNLKTNHRGVYVLTDNAFRPFARMSAEVSSQAVLRAQPFLWFPCGIIRGALAAMGITATVQAETSELPSAVFQIKTVPVKT